MGLHTEITTTDRQRKIARWLVLGAGLALLTASFLSGIHANQRARNIARDSRLTEQVTAQAQLLT